MTDELRKRSKYADIRIWAKQALLHLIKHPSGSYRLVDADWSIRIRRTKRLVK